MSLFTISDLHLSFGADKSMNIFRGWDNYTDRIKANWQRIIDENDTVVIPGDFSWGLKLSETREDFLFLESLPGKKLITKGNHDLWWPTSKKLREFLSENNINSVDIIFNNSFQTEKYAVCGTRGWFYDDTPDRKIILREAARLETSIKSALEYNKEILVFLHYPPVYGDQVCKEIFSVIKKYDIKRVFHGHIHGAGFNKSISEYDGVKLKLVSCDCIDFTPFLIV